MKFFLSIVLLIILIISCAKKEKRPGVLPEKKMRAVMWDLIRADQYLSDYLLKDSAISKNDQSIRLYEEIFQLHHITKDQFKKSLNYYSSQPDLFRPLLDSLAKRTSEFMQPPTRFHPPAADSAVRLRGHKRFQKP